MKTTLNLGSFAFDFDSKADRTFSSDMHSIVTPQNNMTAKVELKDVSITFEASVEETLEDIKATVEVVKEMKNLASEFGNIFAGLEAKRQERREQNDINLSKENFERKFEEMKERINETSEEILKDFRRVDKKASELEDSIATLEQKVLGGSN